MSSLTFCNNNKEQHVPHLTADGIEYVCSRCGVVISSAEQGQVPIKSKLNLYTGHQLGSNGVPPGQLKLSDRRSLKIASRPDVGVGRYLSAFSNACESLGLQGQNASCAWRVFCKVYDELASKKLRLIGAADAAFYAICNCGSSSVDEYEVSMAVSSSFGVKRVRDLYHLRILVQTRIELPQQLNVAPLTVSANWMRGMMVRKMMAHRVAATATTPVAAAASLPEIKRRR